MSILNYTEGVMDMVLNGGSVTPGEIVEFQAMIKVIPTKGKVAAIESENKKIGEQKVHDNGPGIYRQTRSKASSYPSRDLHRLRGSEAPA